MIAPHLKQVGHPPATARDVGSQDKATRLIPVLGQGERPAS